MNRHIFAMLAALPLTAVCFCSCSSVTDAFLPVHKPDSLVYRSDIIISKKYDSVTFNNAEYVLNWKSNSEIYIPSDVKMYGAVVEGEKIEDKEKSKDVDIVYTSESCSNYIWLISSKEIDNDSVIIIPGDTEMYVKKEKR